MVGAGNHGYWLGSYEIGKSRCFSDAVQAEFVVYDLGANAGYYTLLSSKLVGPKGHVYSFEPFPKNLDFLAKHLKLNKISNCTVLDVAVSNFSGTATFEVHESSSMGRLTQENSDNLISVRTRTIDSLVRDHNILPPNLIKCDIEGAEFDALQGAEYTLTSYSPQLFIATHGYSVRAQCLNFLRDLKYEIRPIGDGSFDKADEFHAFKIG